MDIVCPLSVNFGLYLGFSRACGCSDVWTVGALVGRAGVEGPAWAETIAAMSGFVGEARELEESVEVIGLAFSMAMKP